MNAPAREPDRSFLDWEASPSWTDKGFYDLIVWVNGSGSNLQVGLPLEVAEELGAHIVETCRPHYVASRARYEARAAASDARMAAEYEADRPARESAAAARAAALASAPRIGAGRCPECGHVALPDEFDEPGYECSTDGSTGVGPDGRRCDQCNRFRAKTAEHSCPECDAPLPEGPEAVSAVDLDGDLVTDDERIS